MDVFVFIEFTAKPERRASFAELLGQVRLDLAVVPGCKGVRIFHRRTDPCSFLLVERWDSEATHKAHLEKVVRSGAWDHVASHLAGEPVSRYLDEFLG